MTPDEILDLVREHAAAEAENDAERTLATLVDEPTYEFWPMGVGFTGGDLARTFYLEQYPEFAQRVTNYGVLGEWTNDFCGIQEYWVETDGETRHMVMSMMPVEGDLLAGEKLYCGEAFVEALLGPLTVHLKPL
ncbi:hypothetical protein [Candidatus Poriferisocius sp.]|uniref:hypothetical protein n=1 Tax=Candidatus Poriferisocius sp. TaxID=3101276 RepID=UPI003B010313